MALNHLVLARAVVGSLDRLLRPIRLLAFVNAAPGFKNAPAVLNGASDLLIQVFGAELGRQARMAFYQHELVRDAPVAGEVMFALRPA
ncbi:MAG: RidA family protein [Alphaproteobacteria bacterium]|nr:RidA family protein [Alphaproteobacteria bacterium]